MTTLQYKEYQGAVEFEDGHLTIRILHIEDLISTTCDSAKEAQSAFAELVDDYLETCADVGREPSKPFKGTLNIRIGSTLHRNAAMAAADAGDTLNAWIAGAIQNALSRELVFKVMKEYSLTSQFQATIPENASPLYRFESSSRPRMHVLKVGEGDAAGHILSVWRRRVESQALPETPWLTARAH